MRDSYVPFAFLALHLLCTNTRFRTVLLFIVAFFLSLLAASVATVARRVHVVDIRL
jgi:hypothetical protein